MKRHKRIWLVALAVMAMLVTGTAASAQVDKVTADATGIT
jgi:hypothetical protein